MNEELEARIAESGRARFGHGVSDDLVSDAERLLGVRFPASYRAWLLRYGAGYLGGYELQGLAPSRPSERDPAEVLVGDIVCTTLANRRHGCPDHLLELLNHEGDETYFLDLSRTQDGEAPVVRRNAGSDQLECVSPSFAAFLSREL